MDTTRTRVEPGDVVAVTGHRVGERERAGEILEVLGDGDHPRFRVRWDDGRESMFYPGSDAVIRPASGHRKAKPVQRR